MFYIVSSCRDTLVTLFMNSNINPEIMNNSNEKAYQIAKRTGLSFPLFDMVNTALFVKTGIIDWNWNCHTLYLWSLIILGKSIACFVVWINIWLMFHSGKFVSACVDKSLDLTWYLGAGERLKWFIDLNYKCINFHL